MTLKLPFRIGSFILLLLCMVKQKSLGKKKPVTQTQPAQKVKPSQSPGSFVGKNPGRVKEVKVPTHALLSQGKLLRIKDDTAYIVTVRVIIFIKNAWRKRPNREILEGVLKELSGRTIEVQFLFFGR